MPAIPRLLPATTLAVLCACLAVLPAAHGQTEKKKVMLRTLCFEHIDGITKVAAVGPGKEKPELYPVNLYTSTFSDEVEVTLADDGVLRFVVETTADARGQAGQRVVAEGKARDGSRQIALFVTGGQGGMPYRLLVIDATEQAFPMGATLLLNLAPLPVRFTIGENACELRSNESKTLPQAKKVNERNQCNVLIAFAGKDNSWTPVNQTRWLSSEEKRDIAVAFLDPRTKQPTVRSYQDFPPWRRPKL